MPLTVTGYIQEQHSVGKHQHTVEALKKVLELQSKPKCLRDEQNVVQDGGQ